MTLRRTPYHGAAFSLRAQLATATPWHHTVAHLQEQRLHHHMQLLRPPPLGPLQLLRSPQVAVVQVQALPLQPPTRKGYPRHRVRGHEAPHGGHPCGHHLHHLVPEFVEAGRQGSRLGGSQEIGEVGRGVHVNGAAPTYKGR